ncbi:MAG: chromosomal replication initiator DnaA [Acidisphaera sp.]|nr:chromosomal replication initiator DnaA [Acidisphaera sp.]
MRQLGLPFAHTPAFAEFLPAPSNEAARRWLTRCAEWPEGRLALWGEAGCGKTHLLHLWAGAVPLAGPALRGLPEIAGERLAIDDADACPDEPALLHLLNAAAEAGTPALLAARTPPSRWPVRLADLQSRLRAITAVEIGPPEDALLKALLERLLAERQLPVAPALQEWLLLRLPRTAGAVREAVARLDAAALAAGGGVTRALAASVLGELTPRAATPNPL